MRNPTEEQLRGVKALQQYARIPIRVGSPHWRVFGFMHRLNDCYPDTPEGRMWKAVLKTAADDASQFVPGKLNSFMAADGRAYLMQEYILAAEIVGIPSAYVTRLAREAGVLCG